MPDWFHLKDRQITDGGLTSSGGRRQAESATDITVEALSVIISSVI